MPIGLTNHSKTLGFARLTALVSITVRADEKNLILLISLLTEA